MIYREIAKPDCIFWLGYKPCENQKRFDLPNCANCSHYQQGRENHQIHHQVYSPEMLYTVSKVGILEMGGLGSILRTTAIPKRIQEINPNAEIYWFTHARGAELLNYVPNVIPINCEAGETEKVRVEILINFEINDTARRIIAQSDCVAGFGLNNQGNFFGISPYGEYLQRLQIDNDFRKSNRLVMQQILLESIGLKYQKTEYSVQLQEPNYIHANQILLQSFEGKRYKKLIGINIGTSQKGKLKRWQPDKYLELISNLARIHRDTGILVLSGPEDNQIRNNLLELIEQRKISIKNTAVLPNNIEIGNFMAIISKCSAIITSDTFAFHVAQAFDKPTVALAGPMPAQELEINSSSVVIGPKLECAPCYYQCNNPIRGKCMIDISVEEVLEPVNAMLI